MKGTCKDCRWWGINYHFQDAGSACWYSGTMGTNVMLEMDKCPHGTYQDATQMPIPPNSPENMKGKK